MHKTVWTFGGCFTNVSRALQKILLKFVYCTNSTCDENFNLKLCTCAQSLALGTCINFQIEILTINVISGVVYFRENILGSSRNISETAPWPVMCRVCGLDRQLKLSHYICIIRFLLIKTSVYISCWIELLTCARLQYLQCISNGDTTVLY